MVLWLSPGPAITGRPGIPVPDPGPGTRFLSAARRKDNHLSDGWENIRQTLRIVANGLVNSVLREKVCAWRKKKPSRDLMGISLAIPALPFLLAFFPLPVFLSGTSSVLPGAGWYIPAAVFLVLILAAAYLSWRTHRIAIEMQHLRGVEDELRTSRAQYRQLVENIREVILTLDLSGTITYISPVVRQMFGYTVQEVIGRHFMQFIHPDDVPIVTDGFRRRMAGEFGPNEFRLLTKDGRERYVVTTQTPIRDDRVITGFNYTLSDVTDRRKAEDALRESENRYRLLVDNTDTGFVVIDERGTVLEANEPYLRLAGARNPGDVIGHAVTEWAPPGEQDRTAAAVAACARQGFIQDFETVYRHPDGTQVNIIINATTIETPRGKRMVSFCRNITGRKDAEETLHDFNRKLQQGIEEKTAILCESEQKYRLLFESSRDAIMTLEPPDWRFTSGNPATIAMFHAKDEAEFTSAAPWEFSPEFQPDGLPSDEKARAMIGIAVRDGSHFFEWTHKRLDGEEFPATVLLTRFEQKGKIIVQATVRDITDQKRAEETIKESEERVKKKLDALLSPAGDIGSLSLADVIDIPALRLLLEDFYALTQIGVSILDRDGNVLIGLGWQDICTKFHRVNPGTNKNCIESDTVLSSGVAPGTFRLYKCRNNMWDQVTPIIVGGKHMGNLFSGQYFFDDETVDRDLFSAQAKKYGFDEKEYLAALDRAPRFNRKKIETAMIFFSNLAQVVSSLSYANIRLARMVGDRDCLLSSIGESERKYRILVENIPERIFVKDAALAYVSCNEHYASDLGIASDAIAGKTDFDFYPRDLAEKYRASDRSVLESGVTSLVEERYPVRGTESWVSTIKTPVKDEAGNVIGILGIFHDITERRNAEEKVVESLNEKTVLLREIHHRVKNNLQIIISLVNLQMRQLDDERLKQVMAETQNRVRAMALVHEKLYQSEDLSSIDLTGYTRYLVTHLFEFYGVNPRQIVLNLEGGKILIDINTAIPLGLIINELASNALKHAFPHGKTGTLSVLVREEEKILSLAVKDDGAGLPADLDWKNTESLGLRLVISLVEQLDGTIRLDRNHGTAFFITVPRKG